ncbi:MAG: T9SS type A sorting domain-containing protein [Sphaerochaetaceae bacterium]
MKKIILMATFILVAITLVGETNWFQSLNFKTIDTLDGEVFWGIPNQGDIKAQQFTIENGEAIIIQEVDLPDTLDINHGYGVYPKILAVDSDYFGSGFIVGVGHNLISWLSNNTGPLNFNCRYFDTSEILGLLKKDEYGSIYVLNQKQGGITSSVIYPPNLQNGGGGTHFVGGYDTCSYRNNLIHVVGGSYSGFWQDNAMVAINRVLDYGMYQYMVFSDPIYEKTMAVFIDNLDVYALQKRQGTFDSDVCRLVKYQGPNNTVSEVVSDFYLSRSGRPLIEKFGDWIYFGKGNKIMRYNLINGVVDGFDNSWSFLGSNQEVSFPYNYAQEMIIAGNKMLVPLANGLLVHQQTGSIIMAKNGTAESVNVFPNQTNVNLISVDLSAYDADVQLQSLRLGVFPFSQEPAEVFENIKIVIDGDDFLEVSGVVNDRFVDFNGIDVVIDNGSYKTIRVFADIKTIITPVDTLRLSIHPSYIQAVDLSGSIASISLNHAQPAPAINLIIFSTDGLSHMDIYPYRNPIVEIFENSRQVIDTLYVYPGQLLSYSGVLNSMPYNSTGIVGIDASVSIDHNNFSELWSTWQISSLYNHGLVYVEGAQLAWVANDYLGITDCGLYEAGLQNQMEVGETSMIFTSLNLTKITPDGVSAESHFDNKLIISNSGMIGDIDGSGTIDNNDAFLGIQQWINQSLFNTQFNQITEVNLARQSCLFPHPSTANIWAINGYVNDPDDLFFGSLGIGQDFESGQSTIPTFINDDGLITVETTDNFVSILWQNSDGSYQGQDIMVNGEKGLRWNGEVGIEPVLINMEKGQINFQIPPDARVLSLASRQVNYYPSDIVDDTLSPTISWLGNAYPNPFRGSTTVKFNQVDNSPTTVSIYNTRGQLIRILVNNQKLSPGEHSFTWDGKTNSGQPTAAGIYFYKMISGRFSSTKKMIMMK